VKGCEALPCFVVAGVQHENLREQSDGLIETAVLFSLASTPELSRRPRRFVHPN
jgi:hypothetical protein